MGYQTPLLGKLQCLDARQVFHVSSIRLRYQWKVRPASTGWGDLLGRLATQLFIQVLPQHVHLLLCIKNPRANSMITKSRIHSHLRGTIEPYPVPLWSREAPSATWLRPELGPLRQSFGHKPKGWGWELREVEVAYGVVVWYCWEGEVLTHFTMTNHRLPDQMPYSSITLNIEKEGRGGMRWCNSISSVLWRWSNCCINLNNQYPWYEFNLGYWSWAINLASGRFHGSSLEVVISAFNLEVDSHGKVQFLSTYTRSNGSEIFNRLKRRIWVKGRKIRKWVVFITKSIQWRGPDTYNIVDDDFGSWVCFGSTSQWRIHAYAFPPAILWRRQYEGKRNKLWALLNK